MTYANLLGTLSKLSPEQLQQNVTVYLKEADEVFPVYDVSVAVEADLSDVLDVNHVVLVSQGEK